MRLLSLLPLVCLLAAGCSERPGSAEPGQDADLPGDPSASFTVRGLYLGAAYGGAAAVVSHEAIPGFMDAMRMPIRVADPAELAGLSEGDKIQFRLADEGSGYRIHRIERLPPETALELADYGPSAVPPEASVEGRPSPDAGRR